MYNAATFTQVSLSDIDSELPSQTSLTAQTNKAAQNNRYDYNKKRAFSIVSASHMNVSFRHQITHWIINNHQDMKEYEKIRLLNYRRCISECCRQTLWREHNTAEKALEFIAAHSCKSKYCNVCNGLRAKALRKRYRAVFEKYTDLLENYDFMHLTLTVPHPDGVWRGKMFYAKELMQSFNAMRKCDFWKEMVFAGEFGIEMTNNTLDIDTNDGNGNGLHIHIHSLLLVHKSPYNLNTLRSQILLEWNQQTRRSYKSIVEPLCAEQDKERISKISKAFAGLNPEVAAQLIISNLCKSGSTFIGLNLLYVVKRKPDGKGWERKTVNYARDGLETFMDGILECIKYHFKPDAMRSDGTANMKLLVKVLPEIYCRPLYRKFGAFHVKRNRTNGALLSHPASLELNINYEQPDTADLLDEALQFARDTVTHPITNQELTPADYSYTVTRAVNIRVDKDGKLSPQYRDGKVKRLPNNLNLKSALLAMISLGIQSDTEARRAKPNDYQYFDDSFNSFTQLVS